jgi:phosphohistidine phosphatase
MAMTRTLVIMRHAKAEQPETTEDFDRPLAERGRLDAAEAGSWLAAQKLVPDLVLCSPALRTRTTWHEVAIAMATATGGGGGSTVQYENDLYYHGLGAALRLIRGVDPSVQTLLVIGHNPTVSALSVRLDDSARRREQGLKTAGIAVHEVGSTWAECAYANLIANHTPRG